MKYDPLLVLTVIVTSNNRYHLLLIIAIWSFNKYIWFLVWRIVPEQAFKKLVPKQVIKYTYILFHIRVENKGVIRLSDSLVRASKWLNLLKKFGGGDLHNHLVGEMIVKNFKGYKCTRAHTHIYQIFVILD